MNDDEDCSLRCVHSCSCRCHPCENFASRSLSQGLFLVIDGPLHVKRPAGSDGMHMGVVTQHASKMIPSSAMPGCWSFAL